MATAGQRKGISRRTLLIGGGAGLGLLLAWELWPRAYASNLRAAPGEAVINAFLKLGVDGRVIVAVPQAELGQGVWTSLPQILADELGADWRTVSVEPAPLSPLYANRLLAEAAADDSELPGFLRGAGRWSARRFAANHALMITGGSTSIRAFEGPLRAAGAAARALLAMAAARRWNADWQELDTHDGFVWRGADRLPFAALAEEAAGLEPPVEPVLRAGTDHRLTGQPLPRLDVPAKIDGSARFAADVRLPDMVHAAVRSGPPGSTLAGIDRAAANQVPGALAILSNPEWVAVAATDGWAAGRALNALRPRFARPDPAADDRSISAALAASLDGGSADRVVTIGDVGGPFPGASPVNARYEVGLAPSAAIEPLCATARVTGDRLEIWAPTQAPGLARAAAANAAGYGEDQVTIYPMPVGGGYGRKLEMDAIAQAAIIATRLRRPVQLTWPRIQEIECDSFRPAAAAQMTAWVQQGRLHAWQARIAAPATASEVAARIGATPWLVRPDAAAAAGAQPPYGIANIAVDHVPTEIGIRTGSWRGEAHSYTAFFTESFIDELARAWGMEPLSFRMGLLGANPRLARCLSTATSLGGWDGGPPGSGMGIACHAAFGSFIAVLVEVEVTADQRLRVLRAVCAVDCGRTVNPEIVKQQIEGGLIHGISAATGKPLNIVRGVPDALSLGAYGLPNLRDAPEISVELMESEEAPGGVTELAVPVAAPAVANAYFSLSGQRVRRLPILIGAPH
ncbi:MAG: xanthine dehydrogenase family protein molybdopterin-binding subunit [Sphingomonadaceae bacterium]|nr:xanthine dehydrogenase family protein molybdopterin-binding subunit [Sphingomonadaceae bacterium]